MRAPGVSLRLVLIGWGAIGHTTADLVDSSTIDIVGVGVRHRRPLDGLPHGAAVITDPTDLHALEPDVVAEAAGRDAVGPWGRAALDAGVAFIVSSVSAFADPALLDELRTTAKRTGAQVQIHPGALTGVDALAAARPMGLDEVVHRIVKPPAAWADTLAEELCDLDGLEEATVFYGGAATEAASAFPKNANVAMTTALAGIGPAATRIELVADPTATTNRHELRAAGGFGTMEVTMANNPLPANPKTSAMAALSLVRAIENRGAALSI